MHQKNGVNTLALTIIADQVADPEVLMTRMMLQSFNGSNYLLEPCNHMSNEVTILLTEVSPDLYKCFQTRVSIFMSRVQTDSCL